MGYGVQIRKALDGTLPMGLRYLSLRQAVCDYCPLGFTATWAYVTAEARPDGDFRYDEAAFARAVMIIQASRAVWLTEMREFAARRTAEKRNGQRRPGRADQALFHARWPGGATRLGLVAAVSAVNLDSRRQDLPQLNACAATYVGRLGYLEPVERQDLVKALADLPATRYVELVRYAVLNGDTNA
ncbi:hypothetical protein ACIA49_18700 [Kribbella sp. NPDC051587]|uniref:hypothetical protein n=1 Tax=Kribbella sp. NPDC051587 TaxID=3364119 RepID=UPI0037962278